jgi:hypothetical protein
MTNAQWIIESLIEPDETQMNRMIHFNIFGVASMGKINSHLKWMADQRRDGVIHQGMSQAQEGQLF